MNAHRNLKQAVPAAPSGRRAASSNVVVCARYDGGLPAWKLQLVTAFIEGNLSARLPMASLAAMARLSLGHFSRAFRRSVGQSVRGYILERRITRAKCLMLGSPVRLSEVALECGMADQAHFSRMFRRVTGETPTAWRNARKRS